MPPNRQGNQDSPNGESTAREDRDEERLALDRVWEAWCESVGGSRKLLDEKRRRALRTALRQFPEADVVEAVLGWRYDDWPERRKHNDVTVLLRDAAHVEKFRDLYRANAGEQRVVDLAAVIRREVLDEIAYLAEHGMPWSAEGIRAETVEKYARRLRSLPRGEVERVVDAALDEGARLRLVEPALQPERNAS